MWRAFLAACLLCLVSLAGAQDLPAVPRLVARVTDQTATLAPDQRQQLESRLADFERQKGAQVALLIVPTVGPEGVEQYALRVVESWKLGRQGVDDGALLLVAKDDRKLRIEVGYGLEGALNDATAKRIISETIAPRFKQGDYYGGIDAGLTAMIKVIGGEPLPEPRRASTATADDEFDLEAMLPIGFILIFVVGGILRAIFGRFLGAGIVGGVAGVLASLLFSSLFIAVIAGLVAFVFSLFAGIGGGGGGGRGWSSGGSSWGGGSGGGGFSGGGGSFGGGGASGSW